MKKFLKIFGIILGVILLLLFLTPFLFEKQLKDLVQDTINKNVNATVSFEDVDLSIFRNFPDATLAIQNLKIINNAPFEGDTLALSEEIVLQMSVRELFKGAGEPKKIDALKLENTFLNVKVDSLGNNNYDIAIQDTVSTTTSNGGGFKFDVEHYEINNSRVDYVDQGQNMKLLVEDLNHQGTGDFSAQTSTLSTFSTALVSFEMDSVNYLKRNKLQLDADFKMDLENMRYTFLENEALINKLPLTFDGYVQVNENNNEVDLTFKTPTSSFRNFLAVMPDEYSKNIENVETKGDFVVNGFIRGIVDETYIPKMEINITSNNAAFKYPDLPKAVEDITIAAVLKNDTGIAEDTYMNIDRLNFRIDQDAFNASGSIKNLTGNMLVNMALQGTINLANITRAYPLELEQDLNGIVTADLTTSFDMDSVEKEQYQNVKSSGTATIRDFSYTSPEIPNEIKLSTAQLRFNPATVSLDNTVLTTGQTDLAVTGTIQNLMGYLFTDQKLKGNFTASSKTFSVNDFMVKETAVEGEDNEPVTTAEIPGDEAIKIPSFLDANIDFTANKVLYDNLVLENTHGNLRIVDETARLSNVTSNIFAGNILLNGLVSTKDLIPNFAMQLELQSIDIARAFKDMELLRNLAPIAQALQGELTTNIDLRGNLNDDLTPQLQTLAGNALAKVLGARVNPAQTPLLAKLNQSLTFIDLNNLNLKDLETRLTFNNGQVEVQPFDFNIKGIKGRASGAHGFDMDMNYNVALEVPAQYLGSEIGSTLSRLSAQDQENMTVSLPVNITGSFSNPNLNLNVQQAVNNLTQQILATQKEALKDKGRDVLSDIISGGQKKDTTDGRTTTQKDSLAKRNPNEAIKETAKDILGGILGGNKKKKDTTKSQ
ncbi:AsmA-like C-terminal region-containing protein [Salinimicrobium sp. TH3]|uniref:AsmA-like C-terminal region-containing protein n=1 Tax=Salinimicrobium sp. TH3 TaxID=2997342 RepID=UPI002272D4A6|nr:AsmA-like C-terminal region-containing protein [Salinimicrobium sp. TH3]MCY2685914.1 AsmA family protein [Salinimicrobium sp. TH3]